MLDPDQLGCALLIEHGRAACRQPGSPTEAALRGPQGSFP
jgi:hypothetical protein